LRFVLLLLFGASHATLFGIMANRERTFVIPREAPLSISVQQPSATGESYAKQLAAALRMKTTELIWLFVEAEGRLALSREWTEEAREAGETHWNRYLDDIDVLEAALQDARKMMEVVGKL
jgi:hypothetical protein